MTQGTDTSRIPSDRTVYQDIPTLTDGHEITIVVSDETFTGPVGRVDTYGDSVAVERVVQFNMNYKHRIDGPSWTPWKAYLIEEPAECYRINVVLYNGQASRTRTLDAPDEIHIRQS
ncbi:hypothetical protein [Halocatena marina]|uniref:hypothetical protein n=1 Tax=Halocatena marina TaxID=2934937 RepID=UPI00200F2A99|nr:hypothetical protein [Halocatena marina]